MSSPTPSATVVVTQRVAPQRIAEYELWQAGINEAVAGFPGFHGVQLLAPVPGLQEAWVVLYRFDSADNLERWMKSDERAGWLARGAGLFTERSVVQTVVTEPTEDVVTVVVSQRIKPGRDADYRRWQAGIDGAAAGFPGFLSTERFAPVPGTQDDHVVVFRFRGADNLERWLASDERADWLRRAEPMLESWQLATVGGGLGGWFPLAAPGRAPRVAPSWKQAMVVLLALYPTVALLTRWQSPLLEPLGWAPGLFVANVTSVAALTWLLMPPLTRLLAPWLSPAAPARLTVAVSAVLVATYAAMVGLFAAVLQ